MPLPIKFSSLPRGAYVFDKDGTLLDTEYIWVQVFDRFLAPYGIRHDFAQHREIMGGTMLGALQFFQKKYPSFPQEDGVLLDIQSQLREAHARIKHEEGIRMMPGAHAFLERCHDQGIPLALATTAIREEVEWDLERLNLQPFFRAIVTGDDVQHHKPAPDTYLEAAKRLGVSPDRCTTFEDTPKGAQSAISAGMSVVFVHDPRFGVTAPSGIALTIAGFEELLAG